MVRKSVALRDEQRGAYAILFAVLIVLLFIMVAFVVDLSDARARVRDNATIADSAALAAGSLLAQDPIGACNSAWNYIRLNADGLPAGAVSPCDSGVDDDFQARYGGGPGCEPATALFYRATLGGTVMTDPFEVIFIYPVTDAVLLQYSAAGRGLDPSDGTDPCERFGVQVVSHQGALFGGIVGSAGIEAPATAIVRSELIGRVGKAVALLLLDPTGCDALIASGQAQAWVFAHDADNPGRISLDSDGLKNGNPNNCDAGGSASYTIDVLGTQNAQIKACGNSLQSSDPTRCDSGGILSLHAMTPGQVTCLLSAPGQHACEPDDIDAGRLFPNPVRAPIRTTRSPADHEFNCKTNYPAYAPYPAPAPSVPIVDCFDAGSVPPYITQLRNAIDPLGVSLPAPGGPGVAFESYNVWYAANGDTSTGFNACNPAPGTVVPVGNWWVNCTGGQGFTVNIGTGESVEFAGGNIVFQGNVTLQGGELKVNTSNTVANLPEGCRRPNDLCPREHSSKAAYAFFRAGASLTKNAQAQMTFDHTMVYLHSGNIDIGAGSPPLTWTAPHQIDSPSGSAASPFDKLALWSESTQLHALGGQAPLDIAGVFFTPNALFSYTGQANQFLDKAQFFTFRMEIKGQGALRMQPDPDFTLKTPAVEGSLIR